MVKNGQLYPLRLYGGPELFICVVAASRSYADTFPSQVFSPRERAVDFASAKFRLLPGKDRGPEKGIPSL